MLLKILSFFFGMFYSFRNNSDLYDCKVTIHRRELRQKRYPRHQEEEWKGDRRRGRKQRRNEKTSPNGRDEESVNRVKTPK